jgi:hypothetical protein
VAQSSLPTPWPIGQTSPPWELAWLNSDGYVVDLTSATISATIRPEHSGTPTAMKNTPTVIDLGGGVLGVGYNVHVAEATAGPGDYEIVFSAALPGGGVIHAFAGTVGFIA